MKVARQISVLILLGISNISWATYQPFERDILCQSQGVEGEVLKVVYNKTEYPNFGWQGGIHIEMNTGIGELSGFASSLGIRNSRRRTIRRSGPAGQVGNWIGQSSADPFVVNVKLGFTDYELLNAKGDIESTFGSFLSNLTISRVVDTGFHRGSSVDTQEYLLVRIDDDFGHHSTRFNQTDCKVLN